MKLEHFALNVVDPLAMSKWYVQHLGLTVVRQQSEAPYTTFLADSSGMMMIEIYNNPPKEVPDYKTMHPLNLHIAFVSAEPVKDKQRLLEAGATFEEEKHIDDGSVVVMLKDPWGVSIQLCKRGIPMLRNNG